MAASYLIRLDDACSEMDSERWQRVEEVLDEFNIKPIIAVVPDNQDSDLRRQSIDPGFGTRFGAGSPKAGQLRCTGIRMSCMRQMKDFSFLLQAQ